MRYPVASLHEEKKPFECDIFHKNFVSKENMTMHKKSIHGDKKQPSVSFDKEKIQSIESRLHPKIHLWSKVSLELTHNFKLPYFLI
jgi:hypothetical protein